MSVWLAFWIDRLAPILLPLLVHLTRASRRGIIASEVPPLLAFSAIVFDIWALITVFEGQPNIPAFPSPGRQEGIMFVVFLLVHFSIYHFCARVSEIWKDTDQFAALSRRGIMIRAMGSWFGGLFGYMFCFIFFLF